ncbi:MAG: hypothetical protein ACK52J_02555 [bacterium]
MAFHTFALLWFIFFFEGCSNMVMSNSVVLWYYKCDTHPILNSYK